MYLDPGLRDGGRRAPSPPIPPLGPPLELTVEKLSWLGVHIDAVPEFRVSLVRDSVNRWAVLERKRILIQNVLQRGFFRPV